VWRRLSDCQGDALGRHGAGFDPAAPLPEEISIISNVLTRREQFHQSRSVEHVIPSSVQYPDTLS